MTNAFKDFMTKVGAYPKLFFTDSEPKELIFAGAQLIEKTDPGGNKKPAIKILVRDRADGELKQWITESVVVADMLRNIEPKTVFTAQPTKQGAKKGWKIEVKGLAEELGEAK